MPDYCTCGAALPPDALFCHKCGKPQREELVVEEPVQEPEPPPEPVVPLRQPLPPEINFKNALAIRIGFLAASLANLLMMLPYLMLGCPIWLLGAGFFSTYLYRRRSGEEMSVRDGARVGWITGIFSFAIYTVFFTIGMVSLSRGGGLAALDQEQLGNFPFAGQNMEQALDMLKSPSGMVMTMLISLIILFVVFTSIPAAGGALGAKVLEKD